jgi:hypothetical protein
MILAGQVCVTGTPNPPLAVPYKEGLYDAEIHDWSSDLSGFVGGH